MSDNALKVEVEEKVGTDDYMGGTDDDSKEPDVVE